MNKYSRLQNFRLDTHQMLVKSKDAAFQLMDSIMTTENARSLAEFSLSPFFHRQWCSTYEAIEDCRPNSNKLMKRYIQEIPTLEYLLLGIDHTPWECPDSPTMKDRTYQYSHSHSSLNSSVIGQGYSTIAWLPQLDHQGSWTLPLRHERITSFETPLSKATWQLKQVCRKLPANIPKLVVLDCEYGNATFIQQTADINVSKLIRVRSNLCFYGTPETYSGRGRPKKHGAKWKLNESDNFPSADEVLEMEDLSLGQIRVSKWTQLHFYQAPLQTLTLLKIERLNPKKTGGEHRPLWLIWVGDEFLSLEKIWSQYSRRFGVDHWYRFALAKIALDFTQFSDSDSMPKME